MSKKLIFKQYKNEGDDKPSYSIEEKCNEVILKNQSNRQPDGYIHPSSVGRCPRYIYFFMKKIPYTNYTPNSATTQRTFDCGFDHEKRMNKNMRLANILVDVNVPVPKNDDRVKGFCDSIVNINDKYFIVDTKIANSYSFKNCTPHKTYQYQMSTYMIYINIPNGKIYYQNRDNSEQLEFNININDSVVKETKNLIDFYNYNYDNNVVPDVSEIKPKCSVTSCYYYNKCSEYSMDQQLDR